MKLKWTVFWFAGIFAGTLFININHNLLYTTQLKAAFEFAYNDWDHLFFFVLHKRLVLVCIAGLSSLTFFYIPVVYLFFFYFGFAAGAMTALSTARFGWFGILYYSGSVLPQAILYIPMWLLLFWNLEKLHENMSCSQRGMIKRLPAFLVAFILFFGGVFLEAYVNPGLLKYLFAFM